MFRRLRWPDLLCLLSPGEVGTLLQLHLSLLQLGHLRPGQWLLLLSAGLAGRDVRPGVSGP